MPDAAPADPPPAAAAPADAAPADAAAAVTPEAAGAAAPAIEDALSAAEGTRTTARWIASALAGIPSLAIVASIVSGPGDNGFDTAELAVGIGLAAFGAVLGILAFAKVITPLSLEDIDFSGFPMGRIPGCPFDKFADLKGAIASYQSTLGSGGTTLADAESNAARADAEAAVAEGVVTIVLEKLKDAEDKSPEQLVLEKQASEAILHAQEKRNTAETADGAAKSLARTYQHSQGQLATAEAFRQNAYRLKEADEVRDRFDKARYLLLIVVACVAAGLVFVGIAPKPKAEAAAASETPTLVTLTLNQQGQGKIGCSVGSLQALRVGGDEKTPLVITLPAPGCPSKTVAFTTVEPTPLGSVTPAEPIKAE
jgi:hypothetical protein